jgi:hypothetical protein
MPSQRRTTGSRIGGPILAPDGGPYPVGTVANVTTPSLVLLSDVITSLTETRTQLNALLTALREADIID